MVLGRVLLNFYILVDSSSNYNTLKLTISVLDNWRASEASETLLVVVQWKTRYVYIYIYIRETHFSSAVLGLHNVGGVKCQLFLKHSNHWKQALKMIFKGSGCFQFPEAVVTSTVKESLRSTERGSLQVLAVL